MRGKLDDLTGKTIGRWLVLARGENRFGHQPYWLCRCKCGTEREVCAQQLQNGNSTSCGCSRVGNGNRRRHGMSKGIRVYKIWTGMISRCTSPTLPAYKWYGARGISVCDRWKIFENFLTDMGEPAPGLTLDRIDNNGNYEPGNCRWASRLQQARNCRKNTILTFRGESMPLIQWSERLGISHKVISNRLFDGWSVEDALTRPVRIVSKQKRRAA